MVSALGIVNGALVFVIMSLIVEEIIEIVKFTVPENYMSDYWIRLLALVIGIGVAIAGGPALNLIQYLGVELSIPVLGNIITGMLMSRGSQFMHDILDKIELILNEDKRKE